jgi:hypothetical protein
MIDTSTTFSWRGRVIIACGLLSAQASSVMPPRKDPQEGYKTLVEGTPVYIHPSSALFRLEPFKGYDPKGEGFNQEIELTHDLEPMEVSEEEAAKFKL